MFYTTAQAYLQAVKEHPDKFKMGGTGTAQEDQIIMIQLEQATGEIHLRSLQRGR